MANLLIISAWYYPFIHPRAHRWTSLAEYWAAQGHEVHVVCARQRGYLKRDQVRGVWVHRAGFDSLKEVVYYYAGLKGGRGRVGQRVVRPGWVLRLFTWLYKVVWKKIYFPDDACIWYFPARKQVRALLRQYEFDAVISVSLPFTGHLIGQYAKRKVPDLAWLADIGDPFAQPAQALNNPLFYGRLSRRLEAQIFKLADAIVVTNPAIQAVYRRVYGAVADKVHVVPPLLHPAWQPEDLEPRDSKNSMIHLGYFGALYKPVRTPDALLLLLEKTFAARPYLCGKLLVHFFGEVFPEFYEKFVGVAYVQLHGLRSREEIRLAMRQMDILLNIGNTTPYQLPSKAVEYLASGKPVLHLSYVEDDAFVQFWGEDSRLLILSVQQNRVSEVQFRHWLHFLEADFASEDHPQGNRIKPFEIEAVSAAYIKLLKI
ncbi:MAG: glycosyltransferase [Lewinellaceae bacterium]|nr:glycosyltransferase [Saprospiraceae bacterium]MCB9329499.1 glycosyltransferase [Lewinellaceae bacterium]